MDDGLDSSSLAGFMGNAFWALLVAAFAVFTMLYPDNIVAGVLLLLVIFGLWRAVVGASDGVKFGTMRKALDPIGTHLFVVSVALGHPNPNARLVCRYCLLAAANLCVGGAALITVAYRAFNWPMEYLLCILGVCLAFLFMWLADDWWKSRKEWFEHVAPPPAR